MSNVRIAEEDNLFIVEAWSVWQQCWFEVTRAASLWKAINCKQYLDHHEDSYFKIE